MPDKAILVIGAGDATGGAIARRFAREGYIACVTRRSADKLAPLLAQIRADGGQAHGFGSDARQEDEMVALVDRIEREIAPIEVAVFNIGANVRFPITETTARVYFKVWEMACFAGFLMGREAARVMLPRERGTILFTGATASLRGREGFAAFAGAKHALRALAQSMARELWPKGIHVAHPVIDGAIDTEFIRSNFPERYALKDQQGILGPDSIAEAYWQIHQQPRDAWTHETELRPWMGKLVSALQPLPLRLPPGVDLRRALEQALVDAGGSAGFVLQGIGSLIDPALRLADAGTATPLAGPFEILTLAGSVAPGGSHLHAGLADREGRVIGGHLPYGCRVHTTAELLLVLLPGWVFDRQPDTATGFLELVARRRQVQGLNVGGPAAGPAGKASRPAARTPRQPRCRAA